MPAAKQSVVGEEEVSPVQASRKRSGTDRPRRSSRKPAALARELTGATKKIRARKKSVASSSPRAATARSRKSLSEAPKPARRMTAPAALDYAEVARLAYFYWESRGCQGGSPEEDWLRAEHELRRRSDQ